MSNDISKLESNKRNGIIIDQIKQLEIEHDSKVSIVKNFCLYQNFN